MNVRKNKWLVGGAVFAGAVTAIVAAGVVYQEIGARTDAKELPPPGRLVPVGEFRAHIDCVGQGRPTVVLEAGATGFSGTWAWVQGELAARTRVCSYDRAGLGWSDESSAPRDGTTIASELRTLLTNAGEQGPFVLVGHSMGGVFARIFFERNRDDVAGLVLVDSSHPDQLERFPADFVEDFHSFVRMLRYSPMAARVGILRATNLVGANAAGLPEQAYRSAVAFAASPRHLRSAHAELALWDATMEQGRANRDLGDLPLAVLSAAVMPGASAAVIPINHAMHRELATLSPRGAYRVIEGSDHFSIVMRPEHAQIVAAEIAQIVESARGRLADG